MSAESTDSHALTREEQLSLEELKLVAEHFYNEVNLLWKVVTFFLALNGLLLTVVSSELFVTGVGLLRIIVCIFGIIVSIMWLLVGEMYRFYLKYRLERALVIEKRFDKKPEGIMQIFHARKIYLDTKAKHLNALPTTRMLTIFLPATVIFLWFVISIFLVLSSLNIQ